MINLFFIKEIMRKRHMTIGQLSIKTGISKSQLSRILSGKRGIGRKTIKGFLRAFPELI